MDKGVSSTTTGLSSDGSSQQAVLPVPASIPDAGYTFGDLTAIMFSLNVIDKQVGAAWRIKAWQRGGYLPDVGAGTGTRTTYSLAYVWRTCLLAKFQQIGLPPSASAPLIDEASPAPLMRGILRFKRDAHGSEIAIALAPIAQAIEARRAATLGAVHESAVRQDAPNPFPPTPPSKTEGHTISVGVTDEGGTL